VSAVANEKVRHLDFLTMKKNGLADARTIPPGALKQPEARAYLGGISVPTLHRLIRRGLLRPNRSTHATSFFQSRSWIGFCARASNALKSRDEHYILQSGARSPAIRA
jgi:hypothetical protein